MTAQYRCTDRARHGGFGRAVLLVRRGRALGDAWRRHTWKASFGAEVRAPAGRGEQLTAIRGDWPPAPDEDLERDVRREDTDARGTVRVAAPCVVHRRGDVKPGVASLLQRALD